MAGQTAGVGCRSAVAVRRARAPTPADVVIVGAGATGGWAAKRLAEAGLSVVVLDAGRPFGPEDFREHTPAHALPLRARTKAVMARTQPQQAASYACTEWNADWFVNDVDEPYTTPAGPAVPLGRPHAHRRRPHARVGPPELPLQRHRFPGRPRATASASTGRSRTPTWRPTTISSSATSASPASTRASRSCPTSSCSRRWVSRASRRTFAQTHRHAHGAHRHAGTHRQPDAVDQRPPGVPHVRAVRARLRDVLVLQRRLHDGDRRREDRPLPHHHRMPWPRRC